MKQPSSAGCAQHRLAASDRHCWQQRAKCTAPRQQGRDRASSSTWPSCCAWKQYRYFTGLPLRIKRTRAQKTSGRATVPVLQPQRLATPASTAVTLCCSRTSASMPFLTSAGRNDATGSESGVGRAHPSKRRRSMLTFFQPSAHLRQGDTGSERQCPDGCGAHATELPPRQAAPPSGVPGVQHLCKEAVLCHFSCGQKPVLQTDINGNITRCRPRHQHRAPQHASSPQTWP